MLHRVLSLSILGVGLLFESLPAVACARDTPIEDCCPLGPGQPCRGQGPAIAIANPAHGVCCVSGERVTSDLTASAPSRTAEKYQLRGNPPALATSLALVDRHTMSAAPVAADIRPFDPSGSSLYLSTGRLRL